VNGLCPSVCGKQGVCGWRSCDPVLENVSAGSIDASEYETENSGGSTPRLKCMKMHEGAIRALS